MNYQEMNPKNILSELEFFRFRGRMNREKCFLLTLFYTSIIVLGVSFRGIYSDPILTTHGEKIITASMILLSCSIALPNIIFLKIRRLHDFNYRGWWILLNLIPFMGLLLLAIPGTKGPNRFGEEPEGVSFFSVPNRINRIKYAGLMCFNLFIIALIASLEFIFLNSRIMMNSPLIIWFNFVVIIFLAYWSLKLMVSRLHDCNCSGWWILLVFVLHAVVFNFVMFVSSHLMIVSSVVNILPVLFLFFMPGTKGVNRFGEETESATTRYYVMAFIHYIFFVVVNIASFSFYTKHSFFNIKGFV